MFVVTFEMFPQVEEGAMRPLQPATYHAKCLFLKRLSQSVVNIKNKKLISRGF